MMTTPAIQTETDFRQVVVSYGEQAASQGAVYIEGIFTPAERVSGGASWDEVFSGFCDGVAEANERFGVDMRLTTDIPRNLGLDVAIKTAQYAVKYRERGIVGLGLGGPEASFPLSHSSVRSCWPGREVLVPSHTPEKPPGRGRSVEPSRSSKPPGSDTESGRWRTRGYYESSRHVRLFAMSALCRICARVWLVRCKPTRFQK